MYDEAGNGTIFMNISSPVPFTIQSKGQTEVSLSPTHAEDFIVSIHAVLDGHEGGCLTLHWPFYNQRVFTIYPNQYNTPTRCSVQAIDPPAETGTCKAKFNDRVGPICLIEMNHCLPGYVPMKWPIFITAEQGFCQCKCDREGALQVVA